MVAAALTVLLFIAVGGGAEGMDRPLVNLSVVAGTEPIRVAGRSVPDMAVADQLLVGVRRGVGTVRAAAAAADTFGGRISRELGGGRILVVDLPGGSDIMAVARRLEVQSGIAFAEPNRLVYPAQVIPSDPEYVNQPHLPKIRCPEAWEIGTGSPEVIIAVVDSGIDPEHPDLEDRIWVNTGETLNGQDDDGNGYVDDINGWNFYDDNNDVRSIPIAGGSNSEVNHGTLVAGLAAAAANGWGTVGVAWQATIMPLKIFPPDGGTTVGKVVEAIYYAAENGAHIVNLSIGTAFQEAFTDPIVEVWNRGGLTVSAGGNNNRQITDLRSTWVSPACNTGPDPLVDNMNLGVGGLSLDDRKASWSNYDASTPGHFIDVCAPGVNLYGPAVYHPSVPDFGTYFTWNSGTSFSAPLVSGLAALLKAQDMSRTGEDLIRIIRSSCDNIDALNPYYAGELGTGRINAARAMGAELPVSPPTDVRASDTPGDQGGSITVRWSKSADDGAGSDEVTGYVVRRAQGEDGSVTDPADLDWQDIASVPAGSEEYIDATTSDGVPYYYRVAAVSPRGYSESEIVGPAYSRDDSPPPPVTTLTAEDRPLDEGGAIELDWIGYEGSPDLVEFRIYRATRTFSSVIGRQPIAVIPDPSARTFTDETSIDGADYFYAVTGVDANGNEHAQVLCVGPVQSFPNGPVSLAAGLHMMGAPAIPSDRDPATLLNLPPASLLHARYDAARGEYETYGGAPPSEFLQLALGRGFWVKLPHDIEVRPEGSIAPAGSFSIELPVGWQQVANPFFGAVDFHACTVTVNGNTMDLASADAAGVMRSYGWTYDRSSGNYALVHPVLGGGATIPAWTGLWVLVDRPCTLTFSRPGGASAQSASAQGDSSAQGDWALQIIARGAGSVDAANYFGVSSAMASIASPPQVAPVDVSFTSAPGRRAVGRWAASFEPTARPEMTWEMTVSWSEAQDTITLLWPDLSKLPREYSLTLHDPAASRRISMRHQTGYSFAADESRGTRSFRIEASRLRGGGVQITSASTVPTGAGGQVVFSLSEGASCEVTVMNIAGRPVRVVESGRVRAAGTNVVVWDGRTAGGAPAPAGQYLVRISAHGDDGTVASALRTLRVQR